jgi:hypothetical protein
MMLCLILALFLGGYYRAGGRHSTDLINKGTFKKVPSLHDCYLFKLTPFKNKMLIIPINAY